MTVSWCVPAGVEAVVVTVNTDVTLFESMIFTEVGLNEAVVFAGRPLMLRATDPVKPPTGVIVTL